MTKGIDFGVSTLESLETPGLFNLVLQGAGEIVSTAYQVIGGIVTVLAPIIIPFWNLFFGSGL
jgi:hypothetical protein